MNTTPTNPTATDDEFPVEELVRELAVCLDEIGHSVEHDWIDSVEIPRIGDTLVLRLANGQVVILVATLSEGDPCDWCGKDIGDPNTASPLIGPANDRIGRQGGEEGVYCSNECLDRVIAERRRELGNPWDECAECGQPWDREHECGVDPAVTAAMDDAITDTMIADAHALADALIERVRATVPPGGVVTPSEADELWDRAIENVRPGWARVLVSMEEEGPDEGPPPAAVAVVVSLTHSQADLARRAVAFLIEELSESGSHEAWGNEFYGVRLDDLESLRDHLAGA